MFDLGKLGDISRLAGEAQKMQEKQERLQQEQTQYLRTIIEKLDQIVALLKEEKQAAR